MEGSAPLEIVIKDLPGLRQLNEEFRREKAARIQRKLPGVLALIESIRLSALDDAANAWFKRVTLEPLAPLRRAAAGLDPAEVPALHCALYDCMAVVAVLLADDSDMLLLEVKAFKRLLKLGAKLRKLLKAVRQGFFSAALAIDIAARRLHFDALLRNWREIAARAASASPVAARKQACKKAARRPERREAHVDPEFRRRRDEIERLTSTNEQKEGFVNELAQIDPYVRALLAGNLFSIEHGDAQAMAKVAEYARKIFELDHRAQNVAVLAKSRPSSSSAPALPNLLPSVVKIQRWFRRLCTLRASSPPSFHA